MTVAVGIHKQAALLSAMAVAVGTHAQDALPSDKYYRVANRSSMACTTSLATSSSTPANTTFCMMCMYNE